MELDGIPKSLKWLMIFIDRVGFPVLAFVMMFYLCFVTLKENTRTLQAVNGTLLGIQNSITELTRGVNRGH